MAEPSAAWENDSSIVLTWRLPLVGSCVKAVVVMVAKDTTHSQHSSSPTPTSTAVYTDGYKQSGSTVESEQ